MQYSETKCEYLRNMKTSNCEHSSFQVPCVPNTQSEDVIYNMQHMTCRPVVMVEQSVEYAHCSPTQKVWGTGETWGMRGSCQ